jgi:hypothetical protein
VINATSYFFPIIYASPPLAALTGNAVNWHQLTVHAVNWHQLTVQAVNWHQLTSLPLAVLTGYAMHDIIGQNCGFLCGPQTSRVEVWLHAEWIHHHYYHHLIIIIIVPSS